MLFYIGVALLLVIIVGLFLYPKVETPVDVQGRYVAKGGKVYAPDGSLFGEYMSEEVAWNVSRHMNGDNLWLE